MIKLLLPFLLYSFCFSMQPLAPTYTLQASGSVQDMVYEAPFLYAATSSGTVDVFNTTTKQKTNTIQLPDIKDFIGDKVAAKIYSIDLLNDKLLIVSQGEQGYRNLWIYSNKTLIKKIDIKWHYYIKKARFINTQKVVLALLSNEFILFDLEENKKLKLRQSTSSAFSDFVLSEDKQEIVATDESGVVRLLDAMSLKEKKEFKALNLDKVFQIDYKNNTLLTAGQDRKSVLYTPSGIHEFNFDFLLYSCALNQNASLGAIAYNEQNDILIFNVKNQKRLFRLIQNRATLTQILFIEKKALFASSESKKINFWRLP